MQIAIWSYPKEIETCSVYYEEVTFPLTQAPDDARFLHPLPPDWEMEGSPSWKITFIDLVQVLVKDIPGL